MRFKKFVLLLIVCLNFSCATLFNRKQVNIAIQAPNNTKITIDTISKVVENQKVIFNTERSRDGLTITLQKDSLTVIQKIKSKNSFMFYANFLINYGVGALIDLTNSKRFTYKRKLAFDYDSINQVLTERKYDNDVFKKNDVLIYTSPLAAVDVISQPMLTLGGEYFVAKNLSLSAEIGFAYFNPRDNITEVIPYRGRLQRFEAKFHNLINIFNFENDNEYIGIEARFIQRQFSDDISYNFIDNPIDEGIIENIAVKRNLSIFNLKYGVITKINEHFYFDIYSGFGIRIANVTNPGIKYDKNIHYLISDDVLFSQTHQNLEDYFTKSQFNFSLGLKFGYKF